MVLTPEVLENGACYGLVFSEDRDLTGPGNHMVQPNQLTPFYCFYIGLGVVHASGFPWLVFCQGGVGHSLS